MIIVFTRICGRGETWYLPHLLGLRKDSQNDRQIISPNSVIKSR